MQHNEEEFRMLLQSGLYKEADVVARQRASVEDQIALDATKKAPWAQLPIPDCIYQSMQGFSQPIDDEVAFLTPRGIHILSLARPGIVLNDYNHPAGGASQKDHILQYNKAGSLVRGEHLSEWTARSLWAPLRYLYFFLCRR